MKKACFLLLVLLHTILSIQAQLCNYESCYRKDTCFAANRISSRTYKYATVQNTYMSATKSVALYLTVYSPCALPANPGQPFADSINCGGCKRPFILLIHGGSFRKGCRTQMTTDCIEFAKRGYIAATIDYRLGWVPGDEKNTCSNFCLTDACVSLKADSCKTIYSDSSNFAFYRAMQDASAAMRYMVHYAGSFFIDSNYLYVDGNSAGAIVANGMCYLNQQELNSIVPRASTVLGTVNTYGNKFRNSYRIAGLCNNWGSIADTNFIRGNANKIPMIAFHGFDDSIVLYSKGAAYNCSNAAYGYSYGSRLLAKRLMHIYPQLPIELYACYGKHGIFLDSNTANSMYQYRIQKTVCFFNNVRSGSTKRKIVEINALEDTLNYHYLDSVSPVSCNLITAHLKVEETQYGKLSEDASKIADLSIRVKSIISTDIAHINGNLITVYCILSDIRQKLIRKMDYVKAKNISLPYTTSILK